MSRLVVIEWAQTTSYGHPTRSVLRPPRCGKKFPLFFKPMKKYTYLNISKQMKRPRHRISRLVAFELALERHGRQKTRPWRTRYRLCRSYDEQRYIIELMPWSVFGPSMSGNSNKKVCRHKKNHVAKIGLSGQKWATFRLVADMSPTFPAKTKGMHK